ncbi:MAG: hypothetical protein HQK54_17790, partial [Oligoflexales bacterium]|nr:hypothetical protein [Oligoflexales bacterium]
MKKPFKFNGLENWREIFTLSVAISLVYFIMTFFVHFTWSTDDYHYLAKISSPEGLALLDLKRFFSRIPLHGLTVWLCFNYIFSKFQNWGFLYLFAALHAVALLKIIRYFLEETGIKVTLTSKEEKSYFYLMLVVISLYPCIYEVLYWPTDMVYILGALFLSFALKAPFMMRTAFMLCSFMFSEMFICPAFALKLLPLFRKRTSRRELLYHFGDFLLSALILLAIRHIGARFFEAYPNQADFSIIWMINRIPTLFSALYGLHFYKLFPITIPFLIAWLWASFYIVKKGLMSLKGVLFSHFLILFS